MMTPVAPLAASHRPMRAFRGALLAASLLGLGFAMVALVGFPAPPEQVVLYGVAVVVLSGSAVLAWVSARVPALQRTVVRRLRMRFGLLCGGCWIIEMVTASLVSLPTGSGFVL